MAWTAALIAVIWIATLVVSIFSPDLVSGSEQEHLPLAAFTAWLWGAAATAPALWAMSKLRGDSARRPIWMGYAGVVSVIWLVATVLALALPRFETGTDPTKVPLAAVFAPLGAAVLTGLAGLIAVMFSQSPDRS